MFRSVASQTAQPRRRILCDDGSTDDSAVMARQAGWQVLATGGDEKAGEGIAAGRNMCLTVADTEFVAFLDADDWWAPDHLLDCVALLQSNPGAVVAFGALRKSVEDTIHAIPSWVPRRSPFSPLPGLLATNYIPVSAVVARTDVVRRLGGFDRRFLVTEDYGMWLRLGLEGTFVYRDALSLYYRIHAGQISQKTQLLGESALQLREEFLSIMRARSGAIPLDAMTIAAAEAGWQEILDSLWYHGHLTAYSAWTRRYRKVFGRLPKLSVIRYGIAGYLHMMLRRLCNRVGRK